MGVVSFHDLQYLQLAYKVLNQGITRDDRTGTGTIGIFGANLVFDVSESFPLLTTKKLHFKSIIHELLWFISGDTNTSYLKDNGVTIWDEWADSEGNLGPVYGHQWRNWNSEGLDQLNNVINEIKRNPTSRRLVVSAWNPSVLPDTSLSFEDNVADGKAALPPCHMMFQFYVRDNKYLDIQMYQRSVDVFLGLPYNIASYAALLYMVAKVTGYVPGKYYWIGGDVHIYRNHIAQMNQQLDRSIHKYSPPKLLFSRDSYDSIDDFKFEDFILSGYSAYPHIKGDISV